MVGHGHRRGRTGFTFTGLPPGDYLLALARDQLPRSRSAGPGWLGPNLVTPAIIVVVHVDVGRLRDGLIAAGLAAIPREALEAARVDGATEWQVFRRVTVPLLGRSWWS